MKIILYKDYNIKNIEKLLKDILIEVGADSFGNMTIITDVYNQDNEKIKVEYDIFKIEKG